MGRDEGVRKYGIIKSRRNGENFGQKKREKIVRVG